MTRLRFLLWLLLLQFWASGQVRISAAEIRALDSIALQDVPDHAPGIATAIVYDGNIIYQKWGGYADLSDSTLITPQSRFNVASNGKQFTALAALTLIDAGKLRLADDIRKFFPGLFPSVAEKITIQSLLNHTSGLRDCYDLWSLQGITWWKESFDNRDVLRLLKGQRNLNFKPNTNYLYSNTNYILLALIIEKVVGKSFVEFTNEMFKKLDMRNTSFENDTGKIQGPIARAYFNFGQWTTYDWLWKVCGDGNLFSTLKDQIQWEKIVQRKAESEIKRELIEKSQQAIEGSGFKNYGYGLEFGSYKRLGYSFHEGATGAWKATVIRFPAKEVSMITLTNSGKTIPSMQTRQMGDVIFGLKDDKEYFVTKPAKAGKPVKEEEAVGSYLTESGFYFQFEVRDGTLWLKRLGRNDVELEREAANIFHQKFDPAFKQEFTTNRQGKMQVTAYYTNHAPYTLTKQTANFPGFDFTKLSGRYINTETGTVIEIRHKAGKNYDIRIATRDSAEGILITPSKLLVDGYTLLLKNGKRQTTSFYLNGERIKRVEFVRLH